MYYATLTQVRAYLKLDTAETGDDALLTDLIRWSCAYADTRAGTSFKPTIATRYFDVPCNDARLLQFDDHLLELSSITNGDGVAISLSDVMYHPSALYPRYGIRIKAQSAYTWQPDGYGETRQVIALTGTWGYHDDWSNAFVLSGDAVANVGGISAAATSITVTDADGTASDLQTPRFQAGQLIKIGTEYMDVTAVNTGTNALTVVRGVNGSTAATHAASDAISIYRPMGNVIMAVLRLVAWRYRQKDANVFDTTTIIGTGVKVTPSAVPPDVDDLLPMPLHLVYDR